MSIVCTQAPCKNLPFQNKSFFPHVKGILWLSCCCHPIALSLVNNTSRSFYGIYIETIKKAISFLSTKEIVNILMFHYPISSLTRWTGMFDFTKFMVKNMNTIIDAFLERLDHDTCYNIDDSDIHAIIYSSTAIYTFLLPLKTLSVKLEGENFQVCYAYPLIVKTLEEVKKNVVEFELLACLYRTGAGHHLM